MARIDVMPRNVATPAAACGAIARFGNSYADMDFGETALVLCRFITRTSGRVMRSGILLSAMALAPVASAGAEPDSRTPSLAAKPLRMGQRSGSMERQLPDLSIESALPKNYLLPALEIGSFQFLLNRFDNQFIGKDYAVSLHSIRRNLHSSWTTDNDSFLVNQIGHPDQGSVYYGLARSNGLTFWESFGYAFAGSAAWEIAGETTLPSKNDQITTSIGGSFLGESLFRMSHLLLERGGGLSPV